MNTDPEILSGHKCPYCGGHTMWVDDTVIYGRTFGQKCYLCEPCGAYVGCHRPRPQESLGRLANAELREAKRLAHYYFDQLWRRKMSKEGVSKTKARKAGYKWLSKEIGVPIEYCHIGFFDMEECERVVVVCVNILAKTKNTKNEQRHQI